MSILEGHLQVNDMNKILIKLLAVMVFTGNSLVANADSPRQLFAKYADRLYQIKVIEKTSGRKSAIGSGFVVRSNGLMVTNYHVISKYVQEPDKYYLEALSGNNRTEKITVEDIDVVNDLALLKTGRKGHTYLKLRHEPLSKGDPIYSMGNPLDLGTAVVPGTYNGYTSQSFYQRIHFTGAVNPGMSGGPVLDQSGNVVGVNVATAGNQVGFLVVVDKLISLLREYDKRDNKPLNMHARIRQQLLINQARMMKLVLDSKWKTTRLGEAMVLKEIAPFLPCWGDKSSSQKKREKFTSVSINCMPKENIFVSQWFQTGMIEVQYKWVENHELTPMQFSTLMQQFYGSARAGNRASEKDVTDYVCHEGFVENPDQRVTLCTRAYRNYKDLYDVLYISTSVGFNDKGLMSHFTLSGVEQKLALQFTRRFMEAGKWN